MSSNDIWDRCETLDDANRRWEVANGTIEIDTAVKSPLGTGSIKNTFESGLWNTWIRAIYKSPRNYLQVKPTGIYVQSTVDSIVTIDVRGADGTQHVIAQKNIVANTMTEIAFDYSAVPETTLEAVSVMFVYFTTKNLAASCYLSGLTTVVSPLTAEVTPTEQHAFINETLTFNVAINGGVLPYSIQWYANGQALNGQTQPTLQITSDTEGTIDIFCRVTDSQDTTVDSNTVTATFTSAPPTEIWDRCEQLIQPDREWTTNPEATITIDPSIKSPLGTGSIKIYEPATGGVWNTFAFCTLSPEQDFNTSRPKSVFVYHEKDTPMDFVLWLITRPDGAWIERQISQTITVQPFTMTEIPTDYTGIPPIELAEAYQFRVLAKTNQQEATFYISGITAETPMIYTISGKVTDIQANPLANVTVQAGAYTTDTLDDGTYQLTVSAGIHTLTFSLIGYEASTRMVDASSGDVSGVNVVLNVLPPLKPIHTVGKDIFDSNNQIVYLRGIGFEHGHDDPTFWIDTYGVWDPDAIHARCAFLQSQRINFIKLVINADWVLNNPVTFAGAGGTVIVDYLQNIEDLCTIAEQYHIYVEVVFGLLLNGKTMWEQGSSRSTTPYTPYINATDITVVPDTAAFNQAVSTLASRLANHNNALLGIWNEPTFSTGEQAEWDNYFANLANSMEVARNSGFNGILVIMGCMSLVENFWYGGNDNMDWAINNIDLFTNYGSVIADQHAYYCYLCRPDLGWCAFSPDYNTLKNYWLNNCKIAEARQLGICVALFETGVAQYGMPQPIDEQNAAFKNALEILNEEGISWLGWIYYTGTQFSMLTNLTPPVWNSSGQILADAILEAPPTPPIDLPVIIAAGGLVAVDAILVAIYLAKISGYI